MKLAIAFFTGLGVLWNTAALLRIVEVAIALRLGELLRGFVESYDKFMDAVFRYVDPLVHLVLSLIGIDIVLWTHWRHIFTILILYFAMHSRSAALEGNFGAARFTAIWGTLVALGTGVFAGSIQAEATSSVVVVALPTVLGVVAYGAGTSARAATWFRSQGEPWLSAFREFFRHSRRFALFGILTIATTSVVLAISEVPPWLRSPGILLLILLYSMLAIYRIVVGPKWGRYKPPLPGTSWWGATRRSSEARIGFLMLASLGGAVAALLVNAFQ
ncbi:MAG: hypothetical protein IPG66_02470 [Hydrogenophilales bacterium]|nr:hypothetical protein [Hydrogenophilales bacterium]